MAKVLLDMAVSIDGFVGGSSGEDVGLYARYFNPSETSRPVIEELIETTGAIALGRGAYGTGEDSGGWDDTPYAVPHFVITHRPPAPRPDTTVEFVFVTDGIAAAVDAARQQRVIATQPSEAAPTSRGKPWRLDLSMSCSDTSCHFW
jgi:hypothetical protein